MTVALTGGAGFLGAHVVRELLSRGESVRLLLSPGGDRANLEDVFRQLTTTVDQV